MQLIKPPTHLLVCRSAFCLKCWQQERPNKGDRFIVYGTDHQEFKIKTAHQPGLKGFTPHLYTIQFPYLVLEDGKILALKTCLMHGCGIEIGEKRKDEKFALEFLTATEVALSRVSIDALVSLWKGTGYELL